MKHLDRVIEREKPHREGILVVGDVHYQITPRDIGGLPTTDATILLKKGGYICLTERDLKGNWELCE